MKSYSSVTKPEEVAIVSIVPFLNDNFRQVLGLGNDQRVYVWSMIEGDYSDWRLYKEYCPPLPPMDNSGTPAPNTKGNKDE